MAGKIQVGYLISYDYEMLKNSLPTVYEEADTIFLAIDINRKTWKGESFHIEDSFFEWLKVYDLENKIVIYEDDFYIPELSTIDNDTRERHLLSLKMGIGNWLIQVDSDEYFIDFKGFVTGLRKYNHFLNNPEKNKVQFAAHWLIIYKYTENGVLYVNEPMKAIFATNYPNYNCARRTGERVIYLDSLVLHESIARTEEQLRYKLENWGHNEEVNSGFLNKWIQVNENNYKEFKDLYYIEPERWKELDYFPTKNIAEINKYANQNEKLKLSKKYLFFKNLGQYLKYLFK